MSMNSEAKLQQGKTAMFHGSNARYRLRMREHKEEEELNRCLDDMITDTAKTSAIEAIKLS